MSKVLVTGGAGFIGSNLVEELVERGDEVTVLDNFDLGVEENLAEVRDRIELIRAPCADIPDLEFSDLDFIYHLGIPSSSPMYKEDPLLVGNAINDFIKVMELSVEMGAKVVYASSSSLYGRCDPPHREDMEIDAFDFYTEARLAMERLAKVYFELHGVKSVGLRFFSVYGPHEKAKGEYANIISQFLWKMREGERPVIYGDGEQTRDFTHVSDVVQACIKAAEKDIDYEIINVGTGNEETFNRVVDILNSKLGTSIEPKHVENPIQNYVARTKADITKARELLGFEPTVTLEEGIERKVKKES